MFSDQLTSNWDAINARNYSSLAALVFMLLDCIMMMDSEYKHIWMWSAPLLSQKGLYLLTRYLAVSTQIVHYSLVQIYLNRGPVQPQQCRTWFIFLAFSTAVLVAAFDAVLLLRVHALYKNNAKIYMLVVPLALQYVMASFLLGGSAFRHDAFNSHCDMNHAAGGLPIGFGILGGFTVVSHLPLWIATFWKRDKASYTAAATRLVVREGGWSFGILTVYIAGILSYCVVTRSGNPFAIFVWPMVAVSMASCRMIINMRELRAACLGQENMPSSHTTSSITFTTVTQSTMSEEIPMDAISE